MSASVNRRKCGIVLVTPARFPAAQPTAFQSSQAGSAPRVSPSPRRRVHKSARLATAASAVPSELWSSTTKIRIDSAQVCLRSDCTVSPMTAASSRAGMTTAIRPRDGTGRRRSRLPSRHTFQKLAVRHEQVYPSPTGTLFRRSVRRRNMSLQCIRSAISGTLARTCLLHRRTQPATLSRGPYDTTKSSGPHRSVRRP